MMRRLFGAFIIMMLAAVMMLGLASVYVFADDEAPKAKRTIMLYLCGSDLETGGKMASYNLRQVLRANFSKDDDIRFIVMTGGANKWHLEKEYLEYPDDVYVPKDAVEEQNPDDEDDWIVAEDKNKTQISNVYNQIWEAKGADDPEYRVEPEGGDKAAHGKMVLLDGDGVLGDGETAKRSKIDTKHDYIFRSFVL